MAIDTVDKRRSAAGVYNVPDGAIDSGPERISAAGWYSGITIASPVLSFTIAVSFADIRPSAGIADVRLAVPSADFRPSAAVHIKED